MIRLLNKRTFSTFVIRSRNDVEVKADWISNVEYSNDFTLKQTNEDEFHLDCNTVNSTLPSRISLPRRTTHVEIESDGHIFLSSKDRFEVEQSLLLKSSKNIESSTNIRASYVAFNSLGGIHSKKSVEGEKIDIKANQAVYVERIGAKLFNAEAKGDVIIKSLYTDESNCISEQGNLHLGFAHGYMNLNSKNGELFIDSISGSFKANSFRNAFIHIEQFSPRSESSIVCGGIAKVSFTMDALPFRNVGKIPIQLFQNDEVEVLDEIVRKKGREFEDGILPKLVIHGNFKSELSLTTWIDNLVRKFSSQTENEH